MPGSGDGGLHRMRADADNNVGYRDACAIAIVLRKARESG